MVKIEDPEDEAEQQHHQHENQSIKMNPSPSSPPQQPDSPDTVSSISSDHTFHGFSPIKEDNLPSPSPTPSPIRLASPAPQPQPLPVSNRFVRDHIESVTKTESHAQTGYANTGGGVIRRMDKVKWFKRVGLCLRVVEFVVCLASFSVLAADRRRGWALDSFDRYLEFRYSLSVNVIGFAYSVLQGLDLLYQLTTGKDLSQSQIRYCFDFAMDQILAYLLLSASSSAFTRINEWMSNWGQDKFPSMANASVGVSIIAFVAFAMSSLISGYMLCKHRSI